MRKKNIVFFISIIISLLFLSCTEDNSYAPTHYDLKLRFQDKLGNDIIEGISTIVNKYEEQTSTMYQIEVSGSEYKLDVEQSGKTKDKLVVSKHLLMQIIDSKPCIAITTVAFIPPRNIPYQLTHKFVCPYIFGDEEEHIIVSNWRKTAPGSSICTGITVDGKNYSVRDTDKEGNTILLVTLD